MKTRIFLSVSIASLIVLATEILLTRIFSVTLNYHFAFFVISLAMFGLACGGTFFYIFKKRFVNFSDDKFLYSIFLLASLSFIPLLLAVSKISFSFDFQKSYYFLLLILFLSCQLPFFFFGVLMSFVYMKFNNISGKLYFFDLVGAGLGALIVVYLINYFGPINTGIFLAILSLGAVLINSGGLKKIILTGAISTGFIILILLNSKFGIFDIKNAKGKVMENLFTKWNSFSMIRVFGNQDSSNLDMDIDADASTPIIKFDGNLKNIEYLKNNVIYFGYYLVNKPDVLIIGPGGGKDVLAGLVFGSNSIKGVEINSIIVNDVMSQKFKEYSGNLYNNYQNVKIIVDDARSYIRNSKNKYDIIQESLIDTWAAINTGAYSLTENNLYTVEAISEFIQHLTPNGYLSVSRWQDDAPRLSVLYLKAAERLGIENANKHMTLIQGNGMATLLFKKTEFSNAEIEKISQIAQELKFQILYLPNSKEMNEYTRIIDNENIDEFINTNTAFNLKAPTDDSPFFFNKLPFYSIPYVFTGSIKDVGIFLLYGLLIISIILCLILVLISLIFQRKEIFNNKTKTKSLFLIYFSLLGIAFMIIEMSFLHKFTLFLGHPTYSIIVVIFSLITFAGIGSLTATKLYQSNLKSRLATILLIIVGMLVCYNILLSPLFNELIGLETVWRILISILLLGIIGVFMGMPFPIGIKLLGEENRDLIPFCWSLNGIFSVLGSILSVILAMNIGFTKTIFFAIFLYLLALLFFKLIKQERQSEVL